jgi:hypothetical protein
MAGGARRQRRHGKPPKRCGANAGQAGVFYDQAGERKESIELGDDVQTTTDEKSGSARRLRCRQEIELQAWAHKLVPQVVVREVSYCTIVDPAARHFQADVETDLKGG